MTDVNDYREWRHWTPAGVFSIQRVSRAGMEMFALYFLEREIGVFTSAWQASFELSRGAMDEQLGHSTQGLSIPDDFREWNMLK